MLIIYRLKKEKKNLKEGRKKKTTSKQKQQQKKKTQMPSISQKQDYLRTKPPTNLIQ